MNDFLMLLIIFVNNSDVEESTFSFNFLTHSFNVGKLDSGFLSLLFFLSVSHY